MAQQAAPAAREDRPSPARNGESEPSGEAPPTIRTSLGPYRDPFGIEKKAEELGITYRTIYTNEVLSNLSGGLRRDTIYAGKLDTSLTVDFGKLAGIEGLTFFANVFQIHSTGGLRDQTFTRLITVSNIEAYPATRLSELWLEQKFGMISLRVGQITADGEFFNASLGGLFISNDWPTITGANLPSGGPAYPLSTPGIRIKAEINEQFTALAAIFNGDPGEQRLVNRNGLRFPLKDPALMIGEVQYRYNQEKDATGLAGTLRLGGYYRLGRFDDFRRDILGLPLSDPHGTGVARRLNGTSGIYATFDQQLYRPEGGGAEDGIGIYGRISMSPSDRNLISFWADGGVVFGGLVPERPADRFGISFIYSRLSDGARAADRDIRFYSGEVIPLRSYGATIEATYSAQIVPGWNLQPVFQYVFRPAGGIPNHDKPGVAVKGGAVVGLRSTITF